MLFTPKSQLSSVRCCLSDTQVVESWFFSMSCPCLRDAELVLEEPGREQGRSLRFGYQSHLALLAQVSRRDSRSCLGAMSISIAAAVGLPGVSVAAAVLGWFCLPSWCSSALPWCRFPPSILQSRVTAGSCARGWPSSSHSPARAV